MDSLKLDSKPEEFSSLRRLAKFTNMTSHSHYERPHLIGIVRYVIMEIRNSMKSNRENVNASVPFKISLNLQDAQKADDHVFIRTLFK